MKIIKKLEHQYNSKGQHKGIYVICECPVCGKYFEVRLDCLKRKIPQKSCGCIVRKHGMWKNRLYRIWGDMKTRCDCPSHKSYKNYGGRGITVCNEWRNFIPFMNWASNNGYKDDLSIDRIDNDRGYFPKNCRWSTRSEQELNKKKTGNEGVLYLPKCKRWWTRIKRNGESHNIGYFKTKEEAIVARKEYMISNNIKS